MVAQGYNRKYGIDYDETFCPVVRFELVSTFIALAAKHKLQLHQLDVTTAFLNGELKEEIYMKQLEQFEVEGKEHLVCKLKRNIYGLKQSSRCWNEALDKHLKKTGFKQSKNDPCIYILNSVGEIFIIAVYVDDIILAGKISEPIQKFINAIAEKFDFTDMGKLHHFVGIKINYLNSGNIWIGQPAYVSKVRKKFEMDNSKPVGTPAEIGIKLVKAKDGDKWITMNKIKLKYCKGGEMIADILTKGIGKIQFTKLRSMIGLRNISDCEWGGVLRIEHSCQIIEERSWRTFT